MRFRSLAAAAAILLAGAGAVAADEIGEAEYMNACASCHGEDGKGMGPLADLMTVEVPDLTTLASRNDGEFPMTDVIMITDGRTGVRGHGFPMPVWGDRFGSEIGDVGDVASELYIRGRVLSIAQYLQSIQE